MASQNQLLGMTPVDKPIDEKKVDNNFRARFMYHKEKAPKGFIVRTQETWDRICADPEWVDTPAKFVTTTPIVKQDVVEQLLGPVTVPPINVTEMVDNQQPPVIETEPEPPVVEDEPEPPPPEGENPDYYQEAPDPEPEVNDCQCTFCGREFPIPRSRKQHEVKCPQNPNRR